VEHAPTDVKDHAAVPLEEQGEGVLLMPPHEALQQLAVADLLRRRGAGQPENVPQNGIQRCVGHGTDPFGMLVSPR
jgi:hypothetical protein